MNILLLRIVLSRSTRLANKLLSILALSTFTVSGCKKCAEPHLEKDVRIVSAETNQLHKVIAEGSVKELTELLISGVDVNSPGHIGNTPLMRAIEAQSIEKMQLLLDHGADPELANDFNTTALGCAVQNDFIPAIQLLIERGVDRGYRSKYPRKKVEMGMTVDDLKMPEDLSGVMSESQCKSIMQDGMDSIKQREPLPVRPLIRDVQSLAALRLFVAAGDQLGEAPRELRYELVGLPAEAPFTASKEDFLRDQTRRFGSGNPEPINLPFWNDMVRKGCNGYSPRQHFLGDALRFPSAPMWCNDRFGTSLTELPDGRFVQIGGEHEDYYDPDFCIYNDVIVFDGRGAFQIYGYSRDAFPPTDFHSATLVGEFIYVVGTLGYMDERQFGTTPVYRLNTKSFEMQKIETSGDNPGWIHSHLASYDAASNSIRVSGGEVQKEPTKIEHSNGEFLLNLDSHLWTRVPQ